MQSEEKARHAEERQVTCMAWAWEAECVGNSVGGAGAGGEVWVMVDSGGLFGNRNFSWRDPFKDSLQGKVMIRLELRMISLEDAMKLKLLL